MNGKGSARRRTSDARKYADGWIRVFGRKRVRRDSGGKEELPAIPPPLGTSGAVKRGTPSLRYCEKVNCKCSTIHIKVQ